MRTCWLLLIMGGGGWVSQITLGCIYFKSIPLFQFFLFSHTCHSSYTCPRDYRYIHVSNPQARMIILHLNPTWHSTPQQCAYTGQKWQAIPAYHLQILNHWKTIPMKFSRCYLLQIQISALRLLSRAIIKHKKYVIEHLEWNIIL